MSSGQHSRIPADSLQQLRQRLAGLPRRSPERARQIIGFAELYGVSPATIYRAISRIHRPHAAHRVDRGKSRVIPAAELEKYCEIIAALKLRTTNKKGRHLSTARAIELIEKYGVETPQGLIRAPEGLLTRSTVDRHLTTMKLDYPRLSREPAAVRFQASHSNDCWQFDLSPSDLKHIDFPEWVDPARGQPTLMLFSVVDDRSGVSYQEYHCVYGEDVESALRFLFNAMAPKPQEAFAFQGRPAMIYLDNGPVAKSRLFHNVMLALDIDWKTHLPAGSDGTRTTARSKGKVERPFRTVKEAHETLYHFHKPETEREANDWLWNYLIHNNAQRHRSEKHSRMEDWLSHLPFAGIREMCTWEQFCRFAREPERRRVGADARVSVGGTVYELEQDMAGESVILLWGLFDDELFAEFDGKRTGPYRPVSGPVPLHRYRTLKSSKADQRVARIQTLARQVSIPREALTGEGLLIVPKESKEIPRQPFGAENNDFQYPCAIAAKLAIAAELGRPLAKLDRDEYAFVEQLLSETLDRSQVLHRIRLFFRNKKSGDGHAG